MTQKASVKSLKERNRLPLFGIVLMNLAMFYAVVSSADLSLRGVETAIREIKNLLALAGVGALSVVTTFNGIVPTSLKDRLVFWRWTHVLPGHRAFTVHGPRDSRIDIGALERELGRVPLDPAEQDKVWYRLFKQSDFEPEIAQGHQSYLFARDYTAISGIFLVIAGGSGFALIPTLTIAWAYLAFLAAQYLLTALSARNHGVRMVTNTLALHVRKSRNAA